MRLPVLAAAAAMTAAGAAGAASVYDSGSADLSIFGRLEAGYLNSHANQVREHNRKDDAGLEGEARLGVSASSQIYKNVRAVAFAEWEVASESSENGHFDARYAYTGFDMAQYGTLVFGQGDTAKYQTIGMTDVYEHIGGDANSYWDLGGRQEGQLMYINAVGGFSFAFSYQTAQSGIEDYRNHETRAAGPIDVNAGYAAAGSYNWSDGLLEDAALSISYDCYDIHDEGISGNKYSFSAGLSYGKLNDGLYTAFVYSRDKNSRESHHLSGYEGVAGYAFENGLSAMVGYGWYGYANKRAEVSAITSQIAYHFTPGLMVYAEGKFGVGRVDYPEKDTSQHTDLTVNMQYNF